MNAKMIGYMLVCILALYGLVILIRKMMISNPKKRLFEPYGTLDNITSGSISWNTLKKSAVPTLISNIDLTNFNKPYILD